VKKCFWVLTFLNIVLLDDFSKYVLLSPD
jgi:hypothetical protein